MEILCKMRHGSHLYGTTTSESDTDYKGIFKPDIKDVILGRMSKSVNLSTNKGSTKNTAEDVDEEYYSIQDFVRMCCKGEMIALDMIHVNDENLIKTSPEFEFLRSHRHLFYTRHMIPYIKFIHGQTAKYGVDGFRLAALELVVNALERCGAPTSGGRLADYKTLLPVSEYIEITEEFYIVLWKKHMWSAPVESVYKILKNQLEGHGIRAAAIKNNEGIDWKSMSHALRCALQLESIYKTGDITYPLKDSPYLLQVKRGERDFCEVNGMVNDILQNVETLSSKSGYPKSVSTSTRVAFDNFILDVYRDEANSV